MADPDTRDIAEARKWWTFYRLRGLNPLPSRTDAKRPMMRYTEYWDALAPDHLIDRFPTTNLQIMTGRRWRLLVIDLDGPEAIERWQAADVTPLTWITHSGGGGRHLWFRLAPDHPRPLPKAVIWRGGGEHSAIERLCDRSLVMAPPSIHPRTGERYRFLDRRHSPARLPLPAECPGWILRLRPEPVPHKTPIVRVDRPVSVPRPTLIESRPLDRRRILDAIHDKIGLVQSWGVRFDRDTGREWVPCHAVDREDANPSAAISRTSGSYVDLGSGLRLSLFDLGVHLGIYHDWREAASDLGARYGHV